MIVRFLAVVITGLALIAPGAHVFELFRKMALSEQQYYVVQDIYRGWWVVGLLLPAALIANVALAIAVRDDLTARGARDRGGTDPDQSRRICHLDPAGQFAPAMGIFPRRQCGNYAGCFLCFDPGRIAQAVI